ncbi:MAG: exodeoxyribonuclease VII large subunit [Acetobacteraceae bacterium]
MAELVANIPEYTVSEISGAVKRTLETAFGRVRVAGEVTEVRRYPSGHLYFSLKDEGGKLAAVAWKAAVPRLGMIPENGLSVIATGRITAYGERSTYQLVVERLDYAGEGALLARIELLRRQLAEEGLFDLARKRRLPLLPSVIGVITSEQGAVIQDIRTTIARRFPRPILLWPVPVQGEGAAHRIAAAIAGFARLAPGGAIPRPDVLIVARGGGSLEDLMAFNDEEVVRAAAASPMPLISAVGHESDTTLIDFAADQRAPTPTAAAEMAVPVRSEMVADLAQRRARLDGALSRQVQDCAIRLERAARGLPDLPGLVGMIRQRLDDRTERLWLALRTAVRTRSAELGTVAARLHDPQAALAAARARCEHLAGRLAAATARMLAADAATAAVFGGRLSPALLGARLREARAKLAGTGARLDSVSPDAVLARGYALVFDQAGRLFMRAGEIKPGTALALRFADGSIGAKAERPAGRRGSRQERLPLGE